MKLRLLGAGSMKLVDHQTHEGRGIERKQIKM